MKRQGGFTLLDLLRWDEVDLSIEARLLEIATVPDTGETQEYEEEGEEAGDEAEGQAVEPADPAAAAELAEATAEGNDASK